MAGCCEAMERTAWALPQEKAGARASDTDTPTAYRGCASSSEATSRGKPWRLEVVDDLLIKCYEDNRSPLVIFELRRQ